MTDFSKSPAQRRSYLRRVRASVQRSRAAQPPRVRHGRQHRTAA